jgi:uncharacterized protein (DUF58 family)
MTSTIPTPNIYVLFSLIALVVSADVLIHRSITMQSLIFTSIVLAIVFATKVIVDFSARQIHRLSIKREFLDPLVEGGNVRIRIRIKNNSSIPIPYVTINDHYPETFRIIRGKNSISGTIPPHSSLSYEYVVVPVLGKHLFRGLEIIVRDPLNIFNYKTMLDVKDNIVYVKPKPAPLPSKIATIWTRRGLGMGKARIRGLGQEFYELREYYPGDDYRLIDWKSYARLRKLYVKEFEREANLSIYFVIDANRDSMRGLIGSTPLEYMARITLGLSRILLRRGDWVGVVVRGARIIRSGYGRGQLHFNNILRTLSSIEWSIREPVISLSKVIMSEASMIPRRAKTLFFILTTLIHREEIDEILYVIDILKKMGHIVYIMQLIPELFEEKKLKGLEAAIFTGFTLDKYVLSREIREVLSKRGINIVSVGPDDLYPTIYKLIEYYRAAIV